ncbi:MAG: alpha/beta hydrolase [Chloroflexi bacterium]|nr:alpha/beta hydrolase [Chloroflexota bacterium]
MSLDPILLIGGFGSHWSDYKPGARMLSHVSGRRVFIVSINRLSWLVGGFVDYSLMLTRVHNAVQHALQQTGTERIMLVGHSAGGVIGRAYLGGKRMRPHQPTYSGHEHVTRLVTLGSPLRAVDGSSRPGVSHAAWVDRNYPGAFYPKVQYLTVSGRLIEGKSNGSPRQRAAYTSYAWISTTGEQWGDGVVPLSLSTLDSTPSLVLHGIGHSPNWGRWFFSTPAIVRSWWNYFDLGDAPTGVNA